MAKNIRLEAKRREIGLTQEQLANEAAVSIRAYQNYEAGARLPHVDAAIRIARALGTTVEALFAAAD